ncbi:MAG TPA: hypothetical protein VEV85_00560 [Bryobacteraceae bacterium]|nr:hypothetical protein [Bryobacteraceae bacterium]
MARLIAKLLRPATLTAGSVLAAAGAAPEAGSSSQYQELTLAGWLMLIPGLIVGMVVLYLAATAPLWRKRHLHHW